MRDKVDELKQVLKTKKDMETKGKHAESKEDTSVERGASTPLQKNAQALEVKLEAAQLEGEKQKALAQENQDKYLRLYAEFENFRKRVQKEKEEINRYAHEQIIKEILPVLDDFERALSHAENAKDVKVLVDGLKMAERQMVSALERFGLKSFVSLGEIFNPHLHEAMAHQDSLEHDPDTVMAEYRRGYTLQGKLVRPALVAVAKKPEGSEVPGNIVGEAEIEEPTKH